MDLHGADCYLATCSTPGVDPEAAWSAHAIDPITVDRSREVWVTSCPQGVSVLPDAWSKPFGPLRCRLRAALYWGNGGHDTKGVVCFTDGLYELRPATPSPATLHRPPADFRGPSTLLWTCDAGPAEQPFVSCPCSRTPAEPPLTFCITCLTLLSPDCNHLYHSLRLCLTCFRRLGGTPGSRSCLSCFLPITPGETTFSCCHCTHLIHASEACSRSTCASLSGTVCDRVCGRIPCQLADRPHKPGSPPHCMTCSRPLLLLPDIVVCPGRCRRSWCRGCAPQPPHSGPCRSCRRSRQAPPALPPSPAPNKLCTGHTARPL